MSDEQLKTNLADLPPSAAWGTDEGTIFITRGNRHAITTKTLMSADQYNKKYGVTPAQAFAMMQGVTYGWDDERANPHQYV